MALEIIGAGFGRTGTESMKRALEILGYGPCHHMFEIKIDSPEHRRWHEFLSGAAPDWEETFAHYRATVDLPGAFFWRELAAFYPEAKILLTVRDPEDWYESMDRTILKFLRSTNDPRSIALLIGQQFFDGRYDDRDHIIDAFNRHNDAVQAAFGPDRLLTYELGSGWEPLGQFLDCPVPDEAYPAGNDGESFGKRLDKVLKDAGRI